jgi:hypothetical protein
LAGVADGFGAGRGFACSRDFCIAIELAALDGKAFPVNGTASRVATTSATNLIPVTSRALCRKRATSA